MNHFYKMLGGCCVFYFYFYFAKCLKNIFVKKSVNQLIKNKKDGHHSQARETPQRNPKWDIPSTRLILMTISWIQR